MEVEEDHKVTHFAILVSLQEHCSETSISPLLHTDGGTAYPPTFGHGRHDSVRGWAVSRTLEDFYSLHEKLSQVV